MLEWFFKFGPWFILVPTGVSLFNYANLPREFKPVAYYLYVSVISQAVAFFFWYRSINNMPVSHAYTVLEFTLISRFYNYTLKKFLPRHLILITVFAFIIIAISSSVFVQPISQFNSYTSTLSSFLIVIFSMYYMIKHLSIEPASHTHILPGSIFNYGFIIYFSGSLMLFAFDGLMPKGRDLQMYVWSVHLMLLLVLYVFLTAGFLKINKQ